MRAEARAPHGLWWSLTCMLLLPGCATKSPPTMAEIHQQSGSLTNLTLTNAWRAASVTSNAIQNNRLATLGDSQLDGLVTEAMTNNPNPRVAATKVEQAGEYVTPVKAALKPAVSLLGTSGLNMGAGADQLSGGTGGDLRAVQQQQLDVNAAQLGLLRVQTEQLAQRVNLHLALGGSFEYLVSLPSDSPTMALEQAAISRFN